QGRAPPGNGAARQIPSRGIAEPSFNDSSDELYHASSTEAPTLLDWSPQQLHALDAINTWICKRDRPWFYLAGYAGTGKTTLLQHIAATAGEDVRFAAYTGKATSVMRRK